MDFIVVEVCCLDCKKFINLFKINTENYLELKHYLKEKVSNDCSNNSFLIYSEDFILFDEVTFYD